VTLVAGRRSLELPAETRPAVAELLAAGELKVADLPELDAADQLTLARRLVTESIATVPGATAEDHGGRGSAPGNGS
jgi:hypothetical protein